MNRSLVIIVSATVLAAAAGGAFITTSRMQPPANAGSTALGDWTCEMHPQIHSDKPGACPICTMDLHVGKPGASADPHAGHRHAVTADPHAGHNHAEAAVSDPAKTGEATAISPGTPEQDHSGHGAVTKAAPPTAGDIAFWTCPMHPSVRMPSPGIGCPICKMDLVAVTKQELASGIVRMDPTRRQALGVRTSEVKKQTMTTTLRASGVVAWDETRLVDVAPRSGGWIRTLSANTPGQAVIAGTTLFTLSSPELTQAQVEWLTVAGDTDLRVSARAKLVRLGFPESSFAALEQSSKPLDEVPIAAPISGVLIDKPVVVGSRIEAGMRVLRLADAAQVWIDAALPADDLALITTGTKAEIALANGGTLTATVAAVIPWIDDATRTGRVRLVAANPDGQLRPGTYATVTMTIALGERLAVPEDAVVRGGEKQVVFVDLGDGRWQPVRIVPGVRAGGLVELREGPAAGAKVANSGVFLIASESRLKSGMDKW